MRKSITRTAHHDRDHTIVVVIKGRFASEVITRLRDQTIVYNAVFDPALLGDAVRTSEAKMTAYAAAVLASVLYERERGFTTENGPAAEFAKLWTF